MNDLKWSVLNMLYEFNYRELYYCRLFYEKLSQSILQPLKKEFDYVYALSYENFVDTDFKIVKKKAALIGLDSTIDLILANFNSTCRNEIRKTFKDEKFKIVEVKQNWEEFYKFFADCEYDRDWIPSPIDEIKRSISIIAKYHDIPVAGVTCFEGEKKLRIDRIFSARMSSRNSTMKSSIFSMSLRRIIYELCIIGINKNCTYLDLGGVDFDDPKKIGITKFKMYFGPEVKPVLIGRFFKNGSEDRINSFFKEGVDIL